MNFVTNRACFLTSGSDFSSKNSQLSIRFNFRWHRKTFLSVKSGCITSFECHLGLLSDVPFAWRSGIHTSIEMFAQYFCSMPAVLTCLFKIFNKIHTGYWFTIAIPYRLTGRKLNLKIVLILAKMNCIKSMVLHFCSCHISVYRIIYASSALPRLLAIVA